MFHQIKYIMMNYKQSVKMYMLLGSIIILLVIFGYWIFNALTFRLISTDPLINNFPSSSSFIKLNFNKNISNSVGVTGTKGLIYSSSVSKSSLTIVLNSPLDIDTKYQINVNNIVSLNGQKMKDLDLSFTPKALPVTSMSAEQKQAQLNAQQQYNVIQNDGLISLLPFAGGGGEFLVSYTLKYSGQTAKPIIIITASDQKSQNDALSWIKLTGADPNKYDIQYVTGQP